MNVAPLIRRYGLQPHPEGGWYREVHRSAQVVRRGDGQSRAGLTAILFLLPAGEISRWHRVSLADETWHHAGGAPLELLCLPPEGGVLRRQRLASLAPVASLTVTASPGAIASSAAMTSPGDMALPGAGLAQQSAPAAEPDAPPAIEPLAVVPAGGWQAIVSPSRHRSAPAPGKARPWPVRPCGRRAQAATVNG